MCRDFNKLRDSFIHILEQRKPQTIDNKDFLVLHLEKKKKPCLRKQTSSNISVVKDAKSLKKKKKRMHNLIKYCGNITRN